MRKHRTSKRRRGAAAVEFALVAPLLFFVVMCSVEFGRAMLVRQVLTNASRVAAREASLPNSTTDSVVETAEEYAEQGGVFSPTVTVTPNPATAGVGETLTVTTTVGFDDVSWLPSSWFLGGINLQAVTAMRKEGFE